MTINMKGKNLVSIDDLSTEEVHQIFQTAQLLKLKHYANDKTPVLAGKVLGMIFQKPSLRTRVSFESGMIQLGGQAIYLGPDDIKLGKREATKDIAAVLSRYVHAIMARTFSHQVILDLAEHATVPVINGLSGLLHPCQALGDLFTITEKKGSLDKLKLAFIGDGNNVFHSLLYAAVKVGMDITLAHPAGYAPQETILAKAREDAAKTGSRITLTPDPQQAVKEADVIYTDVWTSMGFEAEKATRMQAFAPFQVNRQLVSQAKADAIILHCLPAHRGEEITDEVIDSASSVVIDQAENRMHAQNAVLSLVM